MTGVTEEIYQHFCYTNGTFTSTVQHKVSGSKGISVIIRRKKERMMDENLEYIRKGNTGCVFASVFARNPESIGWVRILNPDTLEIPSDAYMISLIFEGRDKEWVKQWAISQGMYEDITSKRTTGLRLKIGKNVSWVQYFGPDSHVKTRRSPHPELLFTVKLPAKRYVKVGFKGVLHLAHASIQGLKSGVVDKMWNASFESTERKLGYKPTVEEAAKTTFKDE